MTDLIDLRGRRFGYLVARQRLPNANPDNRNSLWLCDCECGKPNCRKEVVVFSAHLRSGHTKTCGSLRQQTGKNNLKHGHGINPTPIYRAWCSMKNRCNNPKCWEYHHYGGRGIGYCDEWEDFRNFLADMGPTWFKGAEFDRIDFNDDYCKANCRWIPRGTGLRSITIQVQWRGETLPLGTAAKKAGVKAPSALYIMRYRNCSFEEAAAILEKNKDGDGLKSNCVRVTLNGKIMPLTQAAKAVGINYFNLYRLVHRRGFSFDQAVKHIRDNKLAT